MATPKPAIAPKPRKAVIKSQLNQIQDEGTQKPDHEPIEQPKEELNSVIQDPYNGNDPVQKLSDTKPKKKQKETHVQYVTSFNLKRTFLKGGVKANMFLSDPDYRRLAEIGMHFGVTWDEVVRGMIDMLFASNDPYTGLKNFIPALQ